MLRLGNPDTGIGPWIILGRVLGRVDSVSEFFGQLDAAKSAPTAARFVGPTMNPIVGPTMNPIIMEPYHMRVIPEFSHRSDTSPISGDFLSSFLGVPPSTNAAAP